VSVFRSCSTLFDSHLLSWRFNLSRACDLRDIAALLRILEELVATGHIQFYGVESEAFTVIDGAAMPQQHQPLRQIFELAEAVAGHAHSQRVKLVAAFKSAGVSDADLPQHLGNSASRPGAKHKPLSTEPDSGPMRLQPDQHHLVCITYPLNLSRDSAVLPTVLDKHGK
jgi:hypothetical protein